MAYIRRTALHLLDLVCLRLNEVQYTGSDDSKSLDHIHTGQDNPARALAVEVLHLDDMGPGLLYQVETGSLANLYPGLLNLAIEPTVVHVGVGGAVISSSRHPSFDQIG